MVNLNTDIISLDTTGLGEYMKRRKIFNYLKKHFLVKGSYSCRKLTVYKRMKRYGRKSFAVARVLLYFPITSQMQEGSLLLFERDLSTRLEPSM